LQIQGCVRDLALFNLAIDVNERAVIIQRKTYRPVQFQLTDPTRQVVQRWIVENDIQDEDYLFPSQVSGCTHLSTRQYVRTVDRRVACIGLDPHKTDNGTVRIVIESSTSVRLKIDADSDGVVDDYQYTTWAALQG
jgi:hypothetical protein